MTSGNPIDKRQDLSAELGGRIIRDKLWFYQSGARSSGEHPDPRRLHGGRLARHQPDARGVFHDQSAVSDGPVEQAHRLLSVSTSGTPKARSRSSCHGSRDSVLQYAFTPPRLNGRCVSGNRFLSLQAGQWIWHLAREGFSNDVTTADQLTSRVTGLNFDANTISFQGRKHARGSLNWYKPGLFYGNHDFKMGFEYSYSQCRSQDVRPRCGGQLHPDPAQRRTVPAECDESSGVPSRSRGQSRRFTRRTAGRSRAG